MFKKKRTALDKLRLSQYAAELPSQNENPVPIRVSKVGASWVLDQNARIQQRGRSSAAGLPRLMPIPKNAMATPSQAGWFENLDYDNAHFNLNTTNAVIKSSPASPLPLPVAVDQRSRSPTPTGTRTPPPWQIPSSSRSQTPSPLRSPPRIHSPTPSQWEDMDAAEIMAGLAPIQSKGIYEKTWREFGEFLKQDIEQQEPCEADYIRFFNFLRKSRSLKGTSLWSMYSRLKNCHLRRYGTNLKQWPRLQTQLSSYMAGHTPKQAGVFSQEEINCILQLERDCPKWVMRKAMVAVAICGGNRCCELRLITLDSVKMDREGAWVTFFHGKQRGMRKKNEFIVPFNRGEPHLCYATRLIHYIDRVRASIT